MKICYECKRADCPDMLAGNAPSEEEVIAELDKLTSLTSTSSKGITVKEVEEFIRRIK